MTTQLTGDKAASYTGLTAQLRGVGGLPAVAAQEIAGEKNEPARIGYVLAGDVTFNKEEKRDA
ncbi:MAG: hypothetical protein ACE5E5_16665 [Phycisphaerae bacterium]